MVLAKKAKFFVPLSDYGASPHERLAPRCILGIHQPNTDHAGIEKGLVVGEQLRPLLASVTVEEDEKMTSSCTLTFNDRNHQVSGSNIFRPGSGVDIGLGYGNNINFFGRRFRFVASYPNFPSSGQPTFIVKGYDGRHVMIDSGFMKQIYNSVTWRNLILNLQALKTSNVFRKKTDTQIISEIGAAYGMLIDADDTIGRHTRVKKKGVTDWEFILKLARINGFTAWVDFGEDSNVNYPSQDPVFSRHARFRPKGVPFWILHFRKKQNEFNEGYNFSWGKDLLEFNVRQEFSSVPTDVEILFYDKRQKKLDVMWWQLKNPNKDPKEAIRDLYGSEIRFVAGDRFVHTINDKPFKSKKDAEEFAKLYIQQRNNDFVIGQGRIIGAENVRPRQVHFLENISYWRGDWRFIQTKHNYTPNEPYTIDFTAIRLGPAGHRAGGIPSFRVKEVLNKKNRSKYKTRAKFSKGGKTFTFKPEQIRP